MAMWINAWNEDDQAWLVTTDSGTLYKRCASFTDAVLIMVAIPYQPEHFESYVAWKRRSGREARGIALRRLARQRQTHDQFQEFDDDEG